MEFMHNKIKGLRAENNMTQSDLAERMNWSVKSVSRKENGEYPIDVLELIKLCSLFNVDIDYFFKEKVAQKENRDDIKL